jgi:polyferredoxin
MRRTLIPTIAPLILLLLVSSPAFAHGLGQSYDLPLPLWLYLYGAGAAVLASFVPISLFAGKRKAGEEAPYLYPRFDLLRVGFLRTVLTSQPLLLALRLLSVGLFILVVLTGLLGRQSADANFAPTFVWIIWWVGLGFFTAFVGNVWPLVNPWKILFEWAEALVRRCGMRDRLELREPYPASWGVWPAAALYLVFVWVENVFWGSSSPVNIAVLTVSYSVLVWGGMIVYGKETWLRRGEVFSVFFSLLARFAPTAVRVRDPKLCRACSDACETSLRECVNCYECFTRAKPEDRELNLRPPSVGLSLPEPVPPGGVFFVIVVLAGLAFDGLLETPLWNELRRATSMPQAVGLIVLPLVFLSVYLGFVRLSQLFGGGMGRLRTFAAAYVYSLMPIAIAYQVAHYYTLLLVQGQEIIRHISDPFGLGWDLFGTADYSIDPGVVGAAFVWYSQVALIVAGHVIAVYLAHLVALRLFGDSRRALWSQLPMLALMILYTILSLWIISQPIVVNAPASTGAVPQENSAQPSPIENLREPPMPKPP